MRNFIFWLALAVPAFPLTVTEKIEQQVLELLNAERIKRQIEPLNSNTALTVAARGHSKNMAKYDFFDHTSPVPGETEMEDRIAKAGGKFGTNEENIYWAQGLDAAKVPRSVLAEWMESKEHRDTVLNRNSHFIGVGCHSEKKQFWVTADFSDS